MVIVTGGAGFIGSNLIHGLNQHGETDILVVDNLEKGEKFLNIRDLSFADFMDKQEFRSKLQSGLFKHANVQAIFHQGACSDTMEYNGRYMMDNNFTYSKELLHFSISHEVPFVYASSAAVYGDGTRFSEIPENEKPLNVYGYSKLLFDQYAGQHYKNARSTVAGLRYFNVYGPREGHKGRMASMVTQLHNQLDQTGEAVLFEGTGGYGNGEQRRDFLHVHDAVKVNLFFADGPPKHGAFNVGTGASRSFNDIANTLIGLKGKGEIRYRAMPEGLAEKYQSFTEADISSLRAVGYLTPFSSLEEGIKASFHLSAKTKKA
ncbi:MAG: ADP-glyceromanno-heptose 6-epimerase [Magnetococcales bacterium]|nr:ADP-glyceromanno-heptose 6-epimerase [Magnetococcales bacterium]